MTWKTIKAAALLALALMLLPCPAGAAEVKEGEIDGLAEKALAFWRVPGVAVVVVHKGEVVYLEGHGVRSAEGGGKVTADTLFPLASCTKAFTSTAMAMLADEGRVSWDDPVRKHVPFFRLSDPLADADVRLRDLACHRTGLGRHDVLWYRSPWTQEEIVRSRDWLGPLLIWRRFETRLATTATFYWLRGPRVPLCGKSPFPYAVTAGLSDATFLTTRTSPVTARVRIDFKSYGQTANVTYDLVATKAGWRIRDIGWRDNIRIYNYPPDMTARQFLSIFTWKWPLLECEVP